MTSVFVVVEIFEVRDAKALREYQAGARAQLAAFGGVVIGRGGEAFDGVPPFGPLLIQRWPSADAFKTWQASDDYRPLLELRRRAANLRIAIIPAVD